MAMLIVEFPEFLREAREEARKGYKIRKEVLG
jgi:hypothetical protein